MDESISMLKAVGQYFFPVHLVFWRTFSKQDQIPHAVVSDLCLPCLAIFHKRTLSLYEVLMQGKLVIIILGDSTSSTRWRQK